MGKLAVKKLAYFISILFTFLILLFSIISSLSGKVDPNDNITAAYFALAALFFVMNTLLLLYWIVRWKYWCFVPVIALFALSSYITSMFQIFSSTKYSS